MIISKISGGLGNQMFQYAIAKAIAKKNNDKFKLDITAYKRYTLHNGYRLNSFNIDEDIATSSEIVSIAGYSNRVMKKLKFPRKKTYYEEKERTIYDKNVFNYDNLYLDGYWQNEQYFLRIREEILNDFILKNELSIEAYRYLDKIISTKSVSVHIRRGDYLNHPEIGVLDLSYYKKAIKYILSMCDNPIFYIFSNDIGWCKENFSFIENKIYIEDTRTEFDDMELMRSCKHNIVANSSFSWWSAWLNTHANKMIIAPKNWMVINPKNYKWSPDSWIEII